MPSIGEPRMMMMVEVVMCAQEPPKTGGVNFLSQVIAKLEAAYTVRAARTRHQRAPPTAAPHATDLHQHVMCAVLCAVHV